MSIRFGSRVFAPGLAGTLATLALLPCLIGLGLWQLARADEKRQLLDRYAAGESRTLEAHSADAIDALPRYQRVRVHGRYEPDRQVLLDNMPSQAGRPGYHIVTPFALAGGGRLLVNRGWVPLGATREILPDTTVGAGPRTLTGRLDGLPRPGLRLGEPPVPAEIVWPAVLNYPTHEQLARLYGPGLARSLLLLDADAEDGYERAWQSRFGIGPAGHVGYAVQWFALAAAVLAIYVAVNLRRAPLAKS